MNAFPKCDDMPLKDVVWRISTIPMKPTCAFNPLTVAAQSLSRISIAYFALLALILFGFTANATNYYLSNSGNDANSGTDPSSPWQTLGKLNHFKSFKPGDKILFKCGDTFYGSLIIENSGTAANPIVFSSYGSGEKPVISGFTKVTDWTNTGNNIWQSTNSVSKLSTCNIVAINEENAPLGRWPNLGYLTFQSHTGKTSLTSDALPGSINWTGAEVVIRSSQWTLERKTITHQAGGSLSYPTIIYEPADGFGFFIQNDVRTLDQDNEWYYNGSTQKLSIYSSSRPVNVYIASQDTLATIRGSFLTFADLSFRGANQYAFYGDWSGLKNISLQRCSFSYSGIDAIKLANINTLIIENCKISSSNNIGINLFYLNQKPVVRNNEIINTGLLSGMGQSGPDSYTAIYSHDRSAMIANNKILKSGYNGIFAIGDSFTIKNNYIDTFCTVLQDGGGIYTANNKDVNRKIIGNLVFNGIGAPMGTNNSNYLANGIYLDDNSAHIEIANNTISSSSNYGIFIHNGHDLVVRENISYDNTKAQFGTQHDEGQDLITNLVVKKNLFVSKDTTQWVCEFKNYSNNEFPRGLLDSNYYARPLKDSLVFNLVTRSGSTPLTLNSWIRSSNVDSHSKKSPKTITDIRHLRFEYNVGSGSKTVSLPNNFIDITGKTFNEKIALAPYSSAILIQTDSPLNVAPTAMAGDNQEIILPVNSITLSGKGYDADGSITSYRWSKIHGPSLGTIVNETEPRTVVSGLTAGTYQFELKVTDNKASVGRDTILVTVKSASNITPVANAGADKTVSLPTDTIVLLGTGSDKDGSITSYLWAQVSGPNSCVITESSSKSAIVTGFTEGYYTFKLTVVDDQGAKGSDIVAVTISAARNIPPIANAGADTAISSEINNIYLTGIGTDIDGSIIAYKWKQITGPNSTVIVTDNQASTQVKNLTAGVYEFEFGVTDNDDQGAKDTVTVISSFAEKLKQVPNSVKIYPNPANDIATIEITSKTDDSKIMLTISDYNGQVLYRKQVNSVEYKAIEKINLSKFSKGVYGVAVLFESNEKRGLTLSKL